MTKTQIISQLNARCVDGAGIAVEFIGTEQYDSNNSNQTDQGRSVNKYRFLGLFPSGKIAARVRWVSFFVQNEGIAGEDAYVEPDSLDGLFRGEVEAYIDSLGPIKDYEIEKTNITKSTATVKVAISDGASGRKIIYKFVEKDQQGVFSNYDITLGSWTSPE